MMNVPLKYVASSGNEYNLKTDGIRTKTANYHKWNWGVNGTTLQYGLRVANFRRNPAQYTTQLILSGSYNQRKDLLERLHEDFEKDVRNKTTGRIIWGDYYIDCYITVSSTEPNRNSVWTNNDITIYCPYPFWIREEKKSFRPQEAPTGQEFLDYDYDFDYDYYFVPGSGMWVRDFPFPSEFELIVYGPCVNPRILIDGYPYQFFDTLGSAEHVVINSRSNKITKYQANGKAVNLFDARNKIESVFQPIPGGSLTLNWSGAFGFDLTLYEERSEPRWS